MMKPEFNIKNIDQIDSPSLVLYEKHLIKNLETIIKLVDGQTERLMPHIKTVKMPQVVKKMVYLGIKRFKTATVVEAEIAAEAGAERILIAHQLLGPKIDRFIQLIKKYPRIRFATIVDNSNTAEMLDTIARASEINLSVYVDVNNGMNRTGIKIDQSFHKLLTQLKNSNHLNFDGFHVYDGHVRMKDFKERKQAVEEGMSKILFLYENEKSTNPNFEIITGGTPTFTSHAEHKQRICSPGTCVLWDWGYDSILEEQDFEFACILITRVISKPAEGMVTIDLGHKSVAAENSIDKRVKFMNLEHYELLSQSEEHGILRVRDWDKIKVGDVLYAIPYHICPTVNLHDYVSVIIEGKKVSTWQINRNR